MKIAIIILCIFALLSPITHAAMREPDNPSNTEKGQYYHFFDYPDGDTHGYNYQEYSQLHFYVPARNIKWMPPYTPEFYVETSTISNPTLTGIDYLNETDKLSYFGIVFHGYIDIPSDGTYKFYLSSDEGSELYIGSTKVADRSGRQSEWTATGEIDIKAGKHHSSLIYFEWELADNQRIYLEYESQDAGISKQAVSDIFYYAPGEDVVNYITVTSTPSSSSLTETNTTLTYILETTGTIKIPVYVHVNPSDQPTHSQTPSRGLPLKGLKKAEATENSDYNYEFNVYTSSIVLTINILEDTTSETDETIYVEFKPYYPNVIKDNPGIFVITILDDDIAEISEATETNTASILCGSEGYLDMAKSESGLISLNPSETGTVNVYVTTLSGVLVWEKSVTIDTVTQKTVSWDPRGTDNKTNIKSGTYILYVKGAGIDTKKKFVVVK